MDASNICFEFFQLAEYPTNGWFIPPCLCQIGQGRVAFLKGLAFWLRRKVMRVAPKSKSKELHKYNVLRSMKCETLLN
ncbi:hypothetical protein SLA2020_127360 [Shorea laevis]